MKKTMLFMFLVFVVSFAKAQTQGAVRKLSIGAEFGLPTFSGSHSIIAGGSLQYGHPVAKSFSITGSAGYLSQMLTGSAKDITKSFGGKTSYGYVPIKAGGKYYFGGNFYGAGEVGAVFGTESGVGTAFTFAPTLGASFAVANKSSLDFGLRYENWSKNGSSNGFVGLRAAYVFGL